ncbi:hypothetical protein BVRB_9g216900 [Beta vulgaris subsp. vulgaris]|uniref:steroid 5-alpha-reductase DET2 n=1 Tax=Beta vulgaris subsp. vulgaris TaxID=3555 RepID=UPI00053F9F0F|nr:steroid 5-alpha-reductase DET2 [Beta vulgaris subsp. vulgaris]KMT00385.1 hypothetical protein BVRB_9g216900 [Beta vulgaris subsp. vulgaris]
MSSSSDESLYYMSLIFLNFTTLPTFITCHLITAPYGRHVRSGWGPSFPSYLSWFLMESPTIFFSLLLFPYGRHVSSLPSLSLLFIFLIHYTHRVFIYPLRLFRRRKTTSGIPITIVFIGFFFNLVNTYNQIRWVSHYGEYVSDKWFWGRFSGGLVVFVYGMVVNVKSDLVLMGLKAQNGGYKIPKGGLFEVVSCPNYLGEILEWLGWALMTWSWAGFGFLLYTCSNLVPRARAHHKWYLEKFVEDYPKHRKAIIPFLY